MSDWAVWPLFLIQLIAFSIFFFNRRERIFNLKPQSWVSIILLLVCIMIVFSLIHDSTDKLNLFF